MSFHVVLAGAGAMLFMMGGSWAVGMPSLGQCRIECTIVSGHDMMCCRRICILIENVFLVGIVVIGAICKG